MSTSFAGRPDSLLAEVLFALWSLAIRGLIFLMQRSNHEESGSVAVIAIPRKSTANEPKLPDSP
jgi:hypothetical protein